MMTRQEYEDIIAALRNKHDEMTPEEYEKRVMGTPSEQPQDADVRKQLVDLLIECKSRIGKPVGSTLMQRIDDALAKEGTSRDVKTDSASV